MKTALYTEDGVTQVVFTPETEFEKSALAKLLPQPNFHGEAQALAASIRRGSFFVCRGGWHRYDATGDESIIVRLEPPGSPAVLLAVAPSEGAA